MCKVGRCLRNSVVRSLKRGVRLARQMTNMVAPLLEAGCYTTG